MRLDLSTIGQLEFTPPDPIRFPSLRLAREALKSGAASTTILNASNEIAVSAFLSKRIKFLDIASVVEETLNKVTNTRLNHLDDVFYLDDVARRITLGLINSVE